jgi:hypothetical protein
MEKLSGGNNTTPAGATTDEQMIHRNIQAIGLHHFPDDEGAKWNIDQINFEKRNVCCRHFTCSSCWL